MILRDGTVIDHETARYKYGRDPMAEYLDYLGTDYADEWSGEADATTGWFSRYGKRILRGDDRGFVWCTKYDNEDVAKREFQELDGHYGDWCNDALCNVCDTPINSDDGACWVCGSKSYRYKQDAFNWDDVPDSVIRARLDHRIEMGLPVVI